MFFLLFLMFDAMWLWILRSKSFTTDRSLLNIFEVLVLETSGTKEKRNLVNGSGKGMCCCCLTSQCLPKFHKSIKICFKKQKKRIGKFSRVSNPRKHLPYLLQIHKIKAKGLLNTSFYWIIKMHQGPSIHK